MRSILVLLAIPGVAFSADFDNCRNLFPGAATPVIATKIPAGEKLRALCFDDFAVMHSGISKTPVYTVEHISRNSLKSTQSRTDKFYEEARLPKSERATLADYRNTGYDRGHMAAAAQRSTENGMAQSFSLANMVPQAPQNNRGPWAKSVEKATRSYAQKTSQGVFVFTGPVYSGDISTVGPGKVWVPTSLFKLVYDPQKQAAWAYFVDNTDTARVSGVISYDELVKRTGIQFLPNAKVR